MLIMLIVPGNMSKGIKALSFPYHSPLILVGAVLFFMIIGKQHLQSRLINYIAASSLAIYLIHGSRPYLPLLHGYVCRYMQSLTEQNIALLGMYFIYTLVIIGVCVTLDKCLSPLWTQINKLGMYLNKIDIIKTL